MLPDVKFPTFIDSLLETYTEFDAREKSKETKTFQAFYSEVISKIEEAGKLETALSDIIRAQAALQSALNPSNSDKEE